jgi:Fe-S-cluster containining protein
VGDSYLDLEELNMTRFSQVLLVLLILSAVTGTLSFYFTSDIVASGLIFAALAIASFTSTSTYFYHFLAIKKFNDFRDGRLFYKCLRCGRCCHLRVDLDQGKGDLQRVTKYAEEMGLEEPVVQTIRTFFGEKHWLRRVGGRCIFLEQLADGTFSCRIYPVRPLACRIYPIKAHRLRLKSAYKLRLRVDPDCKGLNEKEGLNLDEYVKSQGITHLWQVLKKRRKLH